MKAVRVAVLVKLAGGAGKEAAKEHPLHRQQRQWQREKTPVQLVDSQGTFASAQASIAVFFSVKKKKMRIDIA